uniref:AlNc14C167G7919 protein n=1 Tax=Albugo laibachii Nc14 TaxID=890382 RepID=F0WN87_9STRA|nr:AlNc14C167G7919 [Albugo laibachii Nc14]|eukprot:CCA22776.1 AlNc14C167G7919 [Albugo laibachii Nc14]
MTDCDRFGHNVQQLKADTKRNREGEIRKLNETEHEERDGNYIVLIRFLGR